MSSDESTNSIIKKIRIYLKIINGCNEGGVMMCIEAREIEYEPKAVAE